jgi:NAD(P)H-nitrite reductase large subunit
MRYVIVGSGMGGITLAEELKKKSPDASITVVTSESEVYYSRPLLSHGFSREDIESKIVLKSFTDLRAQGIEVLESAQAVKIERAEKKLQIETGGITSILAYDILVLATGSSAFIPPPFQSVAPDLHVINSLEDLKTLRRVRETILSANQEPRWAMIGGGLIGCEVGADLNKAGDQVELFHAQPRLMERQLEEDDSMRLEHLLASEGIKIHLNVDVTGIEQRSTDNWLVKTRESIFSNFHGVILACGFKPRTDLAKEAGLRTSRGILVDAHLHTDDPSIFAIGDATEWIDGKIYAYIVPVRQQALWLAAHLSQQTQAPFTMPAFKAKAKIHGFTAEHPYKQ